MKFHASIRHFSRLFFALFLGLSATGESLGASGKKPNVIVLVADDLGVGDIGFSGSKDIPTPHLDRLAGEGIIFRNGYVSPMCAPTRAAFLTGCYPEKIGFSDNRPGDSRHFGMDLPQNSGGRFAKSGVCNWPDWQMACGPRIESRIFSLESRL